MSKKKKEHVTFDRMPDKKIRINKKGFILSQDKKKDYVEIIKKSKSAQTKD